MTPKYTPAELAQLLDAAQNDAASCEVIAAYFTDEGQLEELTACRLAPRPPRAACLEQMQGNAYPGLGEIRDEAPDGADIVSYDADANTLYVANVIPPDSPEPLLHSAMQVYRYYTSVKDSAELRARHGAKHAAEIKPAVLFFENSAQQNQAGVVPVRRMVDIMGVKLYVIANNNGELEILDS